MKIIKLTQGKSVMVDDSDYEFLNQFKWYALKPTNNKNYYAARTCSSKNGAKRTIVYMHRVLCESVDYVDHWNRNTLDNQRHNLRPITPTGSRVNSTPKGTSKYMGVSWSKSSRKWQSHISIGGKKKYLGMFIDEWDAAKTYNDWAFATYGQYANLNKESPLTP